MGRGDVRRDGSASRAGLPAPALPPYAVFCH